MVIMFEVLMFLFENYMDGSIALNIDNQLIIGELEQVGFSRFEIDSALNWLEGLSYYQTTVEAVPTPTSHALRHFLLEESERLGIEGQGFLLYLEQMGILDPITREIVIDRVMALDVYDIDLGRIKWVVLMVLFNQPDKKLALSLLQDMILYDVLH
jgi:Smg protein